jgi:hypothetical protein
MAKASMMGVGVRDGSDPPNGWGVDALKLKHWCCESGDRDGSSESWWIGAAGLQKLKDIAAKQIVRGGCENFLNTRRWPLCCTRESSQQRRVHAL